MSATEPSAAPPSDLDTLMQRIERINAKEADALTPDDITHLIHYHRRNRERKAAGGKPLLPTVDISATVNAMVLAAQASAPPVAPMRRR